MSVALELLAPAKNKDIGIAAIDCGADAVYIAGPAFGAREAAGNSFADIAQLTTHAHRFGARVYLTLNTIVYEDELEDARKCVFSAVEAGCDALIVQDLGLLRMSIPKIDLHASTQCNIRTVEQARWLASLGFRKLVLARELSLAQISAIASAVPDCEIECFVHGALCVCYSGQCYLSQWLTGRSANRGCCIQACRSRYDLLDQDGKLLMKDKAILSLKDLSLQDRLGQLAEAGATSFKIEGRLKNISYVRNIVRAYSNTLDSLVASSGGKYTRSSWGSPEGGFTPHPEATFNRGYTGYFIDGTRGQWNSGAYAKGIGEPDRGSTENPPPGHSGTETPQRHKHTPGKRGRPVLHLWKRGNIRHESRHRIRQYRNIQPEHRSRPDPRHDSLPQFQPYSGEGNRTQPTSPHDTGNSQTGIRRGYSLYPDSHCLRKRCHCIGPVHCRTVQKQGQGRSRSQSIPVQTQRHLLIYPHRHPGKGSPALPACLSPQFPAPRTGLRTGARCHPAGHDRTCPV